MRKRPATPEELAHLERVRNLPCICCEREGLVQTSPTEAHHLKRDAATGQPLGGGQKAPHFHTIPLCERTHHWNGVHVHMGSREFEARWGNELDLLALTLMRLNLPIPFRENIA